MISILSEGVGLFGNTEVPDTQQQTARQSRVDEYMQHVVAPIKATVCDKKCEGLSLSNGRQNA